MIKKYFLLLLATILLTGVHGQNRQVDLPKNIPLQDILKKAKKQKKHVLLDFGSPRCSPCLFIKNKIFTISTSVFLYSFSVSGLVYSSDALIMIVCGVQNVNCLNIKNW